MVIVPLNTKNFHPSVNDVQTRRVNFLRVGIKRYVIWLTAAWLTQLVERRSAVREVEGSSPGEENVLPL